MTHARVGDRFAETFCFSLDTTALFVCSTKVCCRCSHLPCTLPALNTVRDSRLQTRLIRSQFYYATIFFRAKPFNKTWPVNSARYDVEYESWPGQFAC